MKDTYTSTNHHDFNARYSNTFGWLVQGDKRLLVNLHSGDEDQFTFTRGGSQQYHAKIDSKVEFEFIPVKQGWFNTSLGYPILLQRIPARQWKRGICSNNTQAWYLRPTLASYPLDYKLMDAVFNFECQDLNALIKKQAGLNSVALSKHFALSSTSDLFFYDRVVGQFNLLNGTIQLNIPSIQQEVQDLIRNTSLPWSIVNE